eukprot:scaffold43028_cov49-Cyclotella_meneghiniana.AAC.2
MAAEEPRATSIEIPCFNDERPGSTYYWSPLTVNNVGVVDQAYRRKDGSVGAHMHCHVYHEDIGKKGANNIASVIMRTQERKERLSLLKTIRRKSNTYTMDELLTKLAFCEEVSIWESKPEHFVNWGKHLGALVYLEVRQSVLDSDPRRMLNITIANWPTKDEYGDISVAFECRKDAMEDIELETLVPPGINPYKLAVNDVLYKKPDDAVLKKVKTEKGMRKAFKGELADMKKRKRDDKDEAKKFLDKIAKG